MSSPADTPGMREVRAAYAHLLRIVRDLAGDTFSSSELHAVAYVVFRALAHAQTNPHYDARCAHTR